MDFRRITAFVFFLTASAASAETVLLKKSFHPAPTTVSGTLAPFAVAINGEPLSIERKEIRGIRLNGKDVPLEDETIRSFHLKTDEDEIRITGVAADGSEVPVFSTRLPRIRAIEIEGDSAQFRLEGELKKFTLDGKSYSVESPIPTEAGWIDRPHVVEIAGEAGSSRIYNLNFTEWRSLELKSWSVGLAPIGPPGPATNGGYGLYVWRSWENRFVAGGSASLGSETRSSSFGTNTSVSESKSYALLARFGGYPFLPGQSIFDLKRLIVGPFFGRVWDTEKQTNTPVSGSTTVNELSDAYWIGGFFVHETFLRYRGFGFSLHGDFGFLSGRPGNVRLGFELSYTW